MGICPNCNTEFTLRKEEICCDNCKTIVDFPCWKCKEWFCIADNENNQKESCIICGNFICPSCNTCSENCQTHIWRKDILDYLSSNKSIDEKTETIIKYIISIKVNNSLRICSERNVSISYAKNRIKEYLGKMKNPNISKGKFDMEAYKARFDKIISKPIGETFSIYKEKEHGFKGIELREICNYCVCKGILSRTIKNKNPKQKQKSYEIFTRVSNPPCRNLDETKLFVSCCPINREEHIYPENYSGRPCPHGCIWSSKGVDHNKGDTAILKLKISNEDICKLRRGDFLAYSSLKENKE